MVRWVRRLYALLTIPVVYRRPMDGSMQDPAAMTVVAAHGGPTDGQPPAAEETTQLDDADRLVQLSRLVQGAFARIADRHHLTPVQARLLCVLAQGPRGMTELARCCGVEKAALTGLVDRAERRGLAERTPVPGDRRALRVTLTNAGRRSAAAFHTEVTAELRQLLSPLAPQDREQFRTAMATITQSAGRTAGWGTC
jgi:DNA-binding MarR family transcriptional regulator